MNLLAIDTCTEQGSIALVLEDRLKEARILPPGWNSSNMHAEIARLLGDHGVKTNNMDGFGVTSGPGSFTGVRIGLGAAKAFAEAHQKPLVPVPTLLAIAASAQVSPEADAKVYVPLLDARRAHVYSTVLSFDQGAWTHLAEETVSPLSTVLDRLHSVAGVEPGRDLLFCGPDLRPYAEVLAASDWKAAAQSDVSPLLAEAVAAFALQMLQKGKGVSAAEADANYVRRSDAELFWTEA